MPRLSIIIVTYNSGGDIDACLRSVTAAGETAACDIVVVDNASTDDTRDIVRRWAQVRLIDAGANLGFARATNIGIRHSSGELVLLLNPDAVMPSGTIDGLSAALRADPQAAVVGPRIVNTDGHAELSFGRMISPLSALRQKILMAGSKRRLPVLRQIVERMTRRGGYVDWVTGACLLAYRADLEAVGLLDERFFLYTEDVDLCASIRARGRRVRFVPGVEIRHRRGASADAARREAAYQESYLAFYEKHHPRWVPLLRMYQKLFRRGRI